MDFFHSSWVEGLEFHGGWNVLCVHLHCTRPKGSAEELNLLTADDLDPKMYRKPRNTGPCVANCTTFFWLSLLLSHHTILES